MNIWYFILVSDWLMVYFMSSGKSILNICLEPTLYSSLLREEHLFCSTINQEDQLSFIIHCVSLLHVVIYCLLCSSNQLNRLEPANYDVIYVHPGHRYNVGFGDLQLPYQETGRSWFCSYLNSFNVESKVNLWHQVSPQIINDHRYRRI